MGRRRCPATSGRAARRLAYTGPMEDQDRIPAGGPYTATIRVSAAGTTAVELPAVRLEIRSGPEIGRRAELSLHLIRLGKAEDNDLVLGDPKVSRYHAQLEVRDGKLEVKDLGSTNGTFVNDVRITAAFLEPGQVMRLGDTEVAVTPGSESRAGFVGADETGLGELIGTGPAMRRLYGTLRAVAPTHATVLIQGESGTGKELVARTLHALSGRKGPLVAFDAASTDPEMVRSDLFGHVKGAFTGAGESRDGAFRRAHGGTLFLDEIGELPLDLQSRLLRVLETREVTPLGGDSAHKVDVRLVAATHRDLEAMAQDGRFRLDLYHRLAVVPVEIPALRERPEDVPRLVEHLRTQLAPGCHFTDEAMAALEAHPWPGNVRELRNLVERMGALHAGRPIGPGELGLKASRPRPAPGEAPAIDPGATMSDVERQAILAALQRNGGNKAATARDLGISLSTLHRRLRAYRPGD